MILSPAGRPRRGPGIPSAAIASLIALVVAFGCGQTTSPTPSRSAIAAGQSASPGVSPEASADVSPTPRPTAWPGNAILGINAMGVADGQITVAINDFNKGIATEDIALMRRAADGLAGLEVVLPNVDKIDIFEPMRPFADRYASAIRAIASAARDVRDAIDARDGPAITRSSQALVAALTLYTTVQTELAAWVEQATTQQRLLVK
jgi:hypothetical protein